MVKGQIEKNLMILFKIMLIFLHMENMYASENELTYWSNGLPKSTDEAERVIPGTKGRCRKRPNKTKISKELNNKGQAYRSNNLKKHYARKVKEGCKNTCKRKCEDKHHQIKGQQFQMHYGRLVTANLGGISLPKVWKLWHHSGEGPAQLNRKVTQKCTRLKSTMKK